MLVKTSIDVLLILLTLGSLQELLWGLGMVGECASIYDTHVVNFVCPLSPNIPDQ